MTGFTSPATAGPTPHDTEHHFQPGIVAYRQPLPGGNVARSAAQRCTAQRTSLAGSPATWAVATSGGSARGVRRQRPTARLNCAGRQASPQRKVRWGRQLSGGNFPYPRTVTGLYRRATWFMQQFCTKLGLLTLRYDPGGGGAERTGRGWVLGRWCGGRQLLPLVLHSDTLPLEAPGYVARACRRVPSRTESWGRRWPDQFLELCRPHRGCPPWRCSERPGPPLNRIARPEATPRAAHQISPEPPGSCLHRRWAGGAPPSPGWLDGRAGIDRTPVVAAGTDPAGCGWRLTPAMVLACPWRRTVEYTLNLTSLVGADRDQTTVAISCGTVFPRSVQECFHGTTHLHSTWV